MFKRGGKMANKIAKYAERLLPLGLSIIFIISVKFIDIKLITNMKDIVLSIITFVSIFIGFLTTMLSVLVTAIDKSIMKYLRKKKLLKELYLYIAIPIIVGFVLIIVCLMFIPLSGSTNLNEYKSFYLLVFSLVYFVLLCIRAIIILLVLLFQFIDEETEEVVDKEDELDLTNAFKQNKDSRL